MATLTLTISKLRFPSNGNITSPITVTLEYKEYYADTWTLIDTGINVDVDGTILDSPLPTFPVDPTLKYVIKVTNELCEFEYTQSVIINPYCPVGYEMAPDQTYCFIEEITDAIPPSAGENTVAKSAVQYSTCGSYIYNVGYNQNGTGTSTHISPANTFWVNGAGLCADNNTSDGPLNRTGLWTNVATSGQIIGFSVCIDISVSKTYYVGIGCDNFGTIMLDGNVIVQQNEAAINAQYGLTGACFKVWHIYPVEIPSGSHVLELIGNNVSGIAGMGCELYNNTAAEIAAATSYGALDVVFTSTDYIGQPVVIGSGGSGYTCPVGYSLKACESPYVCSRLITTPILY